MAALMWRPRPAPEAAHRVQLDEAFAREERAGLRFAFLLRLTALHYGPVVAGDDLVAGFAEDGCSEVRGRRSPVSIWVYRPPEQAPPPGLR